MHCRSINDGMSRSPVITDEVGLWSSLSPTGRPAGSVQRYTESFGPAGTCLPCASVDLTTPCTLVLPAYYWATNSIWPSKKKNFETTLEKEIERIIIISPPPPPPFRSHSKTTHKENRSGGTEKGDGREKRDGRKRRRTS